MVGDRVANLKYARRSESLGFRAKSFSSAEEFLSSSRLHETDCLILDVRMPGMNGLRLQHHVVQANLNPDRIHYVTCERRGARNRAVQAGPGRPLQLSSKSIAYHSARISIFVRRAEHSQNVAIAKVISTTIAVISIV